ncbi:MAG: methyltransferase domain-containing protein [Nevskia sp.]|nr:methyltransferase domain-containing protein [Nevskia sp.]
MQALAESHRPGQRTVPCADAPSDLWSDWLLHRRHGGDPAYGEAVRRAVERYADRVLDGARLRPDMVLADVGAGEGLIAFRAIDRLGPSLRVILTDVSQPMLRHAEDTASRLSVRSQCRFLRCGAERLEGIEDASVDVVATRSVLAYVADKQAALAEFRRVL